ncbi:MAG TPA: hypothetical protein VGG06_22355 [Thermoanaerobaculia bacterium]|jgi:hypothetical protein
MHDFLASKASKGGRTLCPPGKELLFGDLIDVAIMHQRLHIIADFVDKDYGFYWDITEPEKYFDLLRCYAPGGMSLVIPPGSLRDPRKPKVSEAKRVFIGHSHSHLWEELRDFLRDRVHLEWEEFNRIAVAGVSTQQTGFREGRLREGEGVRTE